MKFSRLELTALLMIFLICGCVSLVELAPPVSDILSGTTTLAPGDRAALQRGRLYYVRDCTKCHSPVAINRLDPEQWATVLPRMVRSAHLDEQGSRDLEAYITAVLAVAE